MKVLEDLIDSRELHCIQEDASVLDAVKELANRNVGALPVLKGEWVVGIFSERDVVRRVVLRGLDPAVTKVSEVMTNNIVVGELADGFDKCMAKMRAARIRHLPVIDEKRLVGFISMRDLCRHEVEIQAEEIKHLSDYIHFEPPTG